MTTEQQLRAQGVEFRPTGGGRVQPFGPAERVDLREMLRADVARRARAMLAIAPEKHRGPLPALVIAPGPVPPRSGLCVLCGEPLAMRQSDGQCSLCTLALHDALVQLGRLPS